MSMNENLVLTEATYYILLSLVEPRHGYGIMQEAERLSGGRIRLAAGTLYGALTSLCDKGWIVLLPGAEESRKKEYRLTERGRAALKNELNRLRQLVANGEAVLKEEEA
jgi:DNA-binding PadR family transcriptional regulator